MSPLLRARVSMVERSARVRRYHTEPVMHAQNVGEHTYGVMWLVLLLTDNQASRDLLVAALMHDAPEHSTGDVPAPTKRLGGIKVAFDTLEDEVLEKLHLKYPELTVTEQRTLKMADILEGALFCAGEVRRGNRDMGTSLANYIAYAHSLHPQGVALEIITHIEGEQ